MTYEVVFEIKITQGGLMVKKSSYFKIVFEGDVCYFLGRCIALNDKGGKGWFIFFTILEEISFSLEWEIKTCYINKPIYSY